MLGAQRSSFAIFMGRVFAPRGIFVTWAGRYHYLRLTAGAQKTAAAAAALIVAWSIFATTSNVLDKRVLASKETEIARHEATYAELARTLEQAEEFRTGLEARLETVRTALSDASAERSALRTERGALRDRIALPQQQGRA